MTDHRPHYHVTVEGEEATYTYAIKAEAGYHFRSLCRIRGSAERVRLRTCFGKDCSPVEGSTEEAKDASA